MESIQEEAVMIISNAAGQIVKGKRTKRQRPSSPFNLIDMHASDSCSGEEGYPSPTTLMDIGETTEEEEEMANCLILLAQGHSLYNPKQFDDDVGGAIMDKLSSGPKYAAAYQCKTCNRCFSSFQALGGHRASHKRPKTLLEKKTLMLLEDNTNTTTSHLNLQMGNNRSSSYISNNNKSKVHQCSICGAEFSSGQALGGHMRRHRSSTANTSSMEMMVVPYEPQHQQPATKKPRNNGGLCVDLNLPAPEELDSKFLYSSKQQPLLFSASSLVDCHY